MLGCFLWGNFRCCKIWKQKPGFGKGRGGGAGYLAAGCPKTGIPQSGKQCSNHRVCVLFNYKHTTERETPKMVGGRVLEL